jgi:YD repeat-containing protein
LRRLSVSRSYPPQQRPPPSRIPSSPRTYEYDQVNNLTKLTDRKSQVRTFEYDALYRRTAENWLNAQSAEFRSYEFTYNDAGQMLTAQDHGIFYAWHTFGYDNLGRVKSVDTHHVQGGEFDVRLDQKYDEDHRIELKASVKLPGAADYTADLINTYAYDNLSRMTQVAQSGQGGNPVAEKLVNFRYNAIGQFTGVDRFKDLDGGPTHEVASAEYGYDSLGRLKDLSYKRAGTNLFQKYDWTYDPVSRVASFNSEDGPNTYQYNKNSELTSASNGGESYSYDANGNRTGGSYNTTANNQIQNDGTYTYTYDNEGNRASRTKTNTQGPEIDYYLYDHRNRLELC